MDPNPYASPRPPEPARRADAAPQVGPVEGVWQDHGLLVMRKHATLPKICIKTNQPCGGRKLKVRVGVIPASTAWQMVVPQLHALTQDIYSTTATVFLPLCDAWWERRRRAIILGWVVIALGLVLGLGGLTLAVNTEVRWYFIGFPLGIVCLIVGVKITPFDSDVVKAVKIDRDHVWLEGVHPDLVAGRPAFATRPAARVEF